MKHNSKHNRSRIRRTVAAVLIVAALLVFMGVFLVLQCLSFDADGAHVVDRYGILAMEQQESTDEKTAEADTETEQTAPEESEEETADAVRAMMLSAHSLSDSDTADEVIRLAEDGQLNTVILNIKDSEGSLNIPVDTNEIEDIEEIQESYAEDLASNIGRLHDAGIYVVGRIYCLHDETAAKRNADLAMQYESGGRWRDYDGTRWLDPTNPETVGYLCDIAESAANAGCDEILLDDFTFPLRGHIDRIAFYDTPEDQASVLLSAMEEIRQSAGEAKVSLTADDAATLTQLSETAAEDGFPVGDIQSLLEAADRVYVPTGSESADTAVVQEAAPNAVILPVLTGMADWMSDDGDAVLSAVLTTEDALAVLNGDLSVEDYDGSTSYSEEDSSEDEDYSEDSSEDAADSSEEDTSSDWTENTDDGTDSGEDETSYEE